MLKLSLLELKSFNMGTLNSGWLDEYNLNGD